jgi:prophage regulatory protein
VNVIADSSRYRCGPTTRSCYGKILQSSIVSREVTNTAQTIQREPVYLRRKQLETGNGLYRSTVYQYIKDGVFRKSVRLGPHAVDWLELEVRVWIAGRVKIARDDSRRLAK